MKQTIDKLAMKAFQKYLGPLQVRLKVPVKKESDLSWAYYPGISSIHDRMMNDPVFERRFNPLHRMVTMVSTAGKPYYPILTAKAALLSELTGMNCFPLLLRYENPTNLPSLSRSLEGSMGLMLWCQVKPLERDILDQSVVDPEAKPIFDMDLLSGAALAGVLSAARYRRKSLKKMAVTVDVGDPHLKFLIQELLVLGAENMTLIDERGELYLRRPNMNQEKNLLVKVLNPKKTGKSREDILKTTDCYITGQKGALSMAMCSNLPDRCVIVSLRADRIEKKPQQVLISTLPHLPNHITDLHLAVGLLEAMKQGKKISRKPLHQAIKGLSEVYARPSPKRMLPGLLEKNLGKKIAKAIR